MKFFRKARQFIVYLLTVIIFLNSSYNHRNFIVYADSEKAAEASNTDNNEVDNQKSYKISANVLKVEDAGSNLSINTDSNTATEGDTVKFTITYSGNYEYSINITDENENDVELSKDNDTYKFVMPASSVEISVIENATSDMTQYINIVASDSQEKLSELAGQVIEEGDAYAEIEKAVNWKDILQGTATVTLTEKDYANYEECDNTDYLFVVDTSSSMSTNTNSEIHNYSSPCLNPEHFYLNKDNAKINLFNYQIGMYREVHTHNDSVVEDGEFYDVLGLFKDVKCQSCSYETYMSARSHLIDNHYDMSDNQIYITENSSCYGKIDIVKNSLITFVEELENDSEVSILGFNTTNENDELINSYNSSMFTSNKSDVINVINGLSAGNYADTYLNDVAAQVENYMSTHDNKRQLKVILITDGNSDNGYDSWNELKSKSNGNNSSIFTIGIGMLYNSEIAETLKNISTSREYCQTVSTNKNGNPESILDNILNIIKKVPIMSMTSDRVVTDELSDNFDFYGFDNDPKKTELKEENGVSASYNSDTHTITWNIPDTLNTTNSFSYGIKLKDSLRYKAYDGEYLVGTEDKIQKNTGTRMTFVYLNGPNATRKETIYASPGKLKYGVYNIGASINWLISGSNTPKCEVSLNQISNDTSSIVAKKLLSDDNNTIFTKTDNNLPLIKYDEEGTLKYSYTASLGSPSSGYNTSKINYSGSDIEPDYELCLMPYKTKAKLINIDEETGKKLTGALFTVYEYNKESDSFTPYTGTSSAISSELTMVLDETERGVFETPTWLYYTPSNEGTFMLVETSATVGYYGDYDDLEEIKEISKKNTYVFKITTSEDTQILISTNTYDNEDVFTSKRVQGRINATVVDKETGLNEAQGSATLDGAVYGLYAAANIIHADKQTTNINYINDGIPGLLYKNGDLVRSITVEDGKAIFDNIELGSYYIKQISASEGYIADNEQTPVNLKYVDDKQKVVNSDVTVCEYVKKAALTFTKEEWDVTAGYSIYSINSMANGIYKNLSDDEIIQHIIDNYRNNTTLRYQMEKEAPAIIGAFASSLEIKEGLIGKSYKYNNDDMYSLDENNTYFYTQEIQTKNGMVTTPRLPYGKYVVIETSVPDGTYAIKPFIINIENDDKNGTVYGDGNGTLQNIKVISQETNENYIKIVTLDSLENEIVKTEGSKYVIHSVDDSWVENYLSSASSSEKKKYIKTYDDLVVFTDRNNKGSYENPFITEILTIDGEKCICIVTDFPLYEGEYILEELAAPKGYVLSGKEGKIAVDDNSKTFYEDKNTGSWIENPQEKTHFYVSHDEAVYSATYGGMLQTVKQHNEAATGKISIFAQGAQLTDVKSTQRTCLNIIQDTFYSASKFVSGVLSTFKNSKDVSMTADTLTEDEVYSILSDKEIKYNELSFIYENKPLENMEYVITAAENVVSQYDNNKIIYNAGDKICTLITNSDGKCWYDNIPIGKYKITCTNVSDGMYLENKESYFDITYAGQEVPVIYESQSYTLPRTQLNVNVSAKSDTDQPLHNAILGIYNTETIKDYMGNTLVNSGTLCDIAWSERTTDGVIYDAQFNNSLPLGNYIVRELDAPSGYQTSCQTLAVNGSTTKKDDEMYLSITGSINHSANGIYFTNTSSDASGDLLTDAEYAIYDSSNNNIYEFIQSNSKQLVSGIFTVGENYTLKMTKAAPGYAKAPDITFTVEDTDENDSSTWQLINVDSSPININVMVFECPEDYAEEEITQIISENTTIDTPLSTESISTAEVKRTGSASSLTMIPSVKGYFANTENKEKVSITNLSTSFFASFSSLNGKACTISKVPAGDYFVMYDNAPEGYYFDNEKRITITDDVANQTVILYVKPITVKINTYYKDADGNSTPLSNVDLKIVTEKGSSITTVDANSTENYSCEFTSNGTATVIKYLPFGSYKIVATEVPDGYTPEAESKSFEIVSSNFNYELNYNIYLKEAVPKSTNTTNTDVDNDDKNINSNSKSASTVNSSLPRTGDETNIAIYFLIIIVTFIIIIFVFIAKRKAYSKNMHNNVNKKDKC